MSGQLKLVLVDHGVSNFASVGYALDRLGVSYRVSNLAKEVETAEAYILPGVGSFAHAMNHLRKCKLTEVLSEQVLVKRKPFLGICLGMQLLAKQSQEGQGIKGLGWIDAKVEAISQHAPARLPHVGWNSVSPKADSLFQKMEAQPYFYFNHGFHLVGAKQTVVATTHHGVDLVAAVRKDNIVATQFHPELSSTAGSQFLRNFFTELC